MNKNKK